MKNEHILKLLEQQPISSLSDDERSRIEVHITTCSDCLRAYQAARASAALLRARAEELVEPSPYFGTRVMAALGESASGQEFTLAAMWRPIRAMVTSMVFFVAILVALTYLNNFTSPTDSQYLSTDNSLYSPESVVLENGDLTGELTNSQVLLTLYESPGTYGEYK